MSIKVLIVFSNSLFSEGVLRLFEDVGDIEVVGILDVGASPGKIIESLKPDVILVDLTALYNVFVDFDETPGINFILFDTCCGEDNIISAVISKEIKGLILANTPPDLLMKSIRSVARGEVWLDKSTVKNLITGMNAIRKNSKSPMLTKREKEIVALVGKGFKNKEIAQKLYISEPTVKTHLHRVFQKLNVRNRPQLITYVLNNHDIYQKNL
ncbi:MAG: response regulator transcription factor [Proteobacteria bacterium]|nr:response regulator transcription factor [Pseudomonadota bacterium]